MHQPYKPAPSAPKHGYCDFAQYDGACHSAPLPSSPKYPPNPNFVIPEVPAEPKLRHSRSTHQTQTSSFPKYPPNPNFVIPRAVAESIFACQCISHISQRPLHPSMDTATSRSKTVLVIPRPSRHPRSTRRTQTSSFPKYAPNPNFVIPEVPTKPKLRHSARSRGIHLRLPMHQPDKPVPSAPKHGYCDFAQYDGACHSAPLPSSPKYPPNPNFVIPEVPAEPKLRHSRSTHRTQTSSFPKYPPNPNFVIPEVPAEPKLRHSARSRGIHLRLPMHQPDKPVPSAPKHGYCDFAQYDGACHSAPLPSSPKYPPNPNFVIPEVPAEPKLRHSARSRGIHLRLPMHQPDKPVPSAPKHGYCDFAQYDGACHSAPLPSSPKYPPNPNFVIPEVPTEPKLRHSARSRGIHLRLPMHQPDKPASSAPKHGYCDFAQYDGACHSAPLPSSPKYPPNPNFVIPEVPTEPKLRHSARSRGIHLRLPMHQPYKPAPSAPKHGYCDFAQYDDRRHSVRSRGIHASLSNAPITPPASVVSRTSHSTQAGAWNDDARRWAMGFSPCRAAAML